MDKFLVTTTLESYITILRCFIRVTTGADNIPYPDPLAQMLNARAIILAECIVTDHFCGQSYKASTIVIYDSRVVPDLKIPHIMILEL